jgi:hypothetical protein
MMVDALAAPQLSTAWQLGTQRRRLALLSVLVVLLSLLGSQLVLRYGPIVAILLGCLITVAAITWRPVVGLYVIFGMVMMFEVKSADELMLPGQLFHMGLQSSFKLSGFVTSPLEMLLLLTLGVWLAQGIMRRRLDFRAGRRLLWWPTVLFTAMLALGLVRAVVTFSDTYIAFWEARALLYLLPCYILTANLIRSRRQVGTLLVIALTVVNLFALEAVYRHFALIESGELLKREVPIEMAFSHESVVFLGALLLLIVAQWVLPAPLWQRLVGALMLPVAIFALLATERRAAYIAVMLAFVAFGIVFLVKHRRAFVLVTLPVLIGGAIYLPIFWRDTGLLGQPARAVRSLSEPDPRDASSNNYRALERVNVILTMKANPVWGIGFGRPFHFVVSLPSLWWWEFWRYEPHHNLMWLWLKVGAIGFALFWILMGTGLALAAHLARTLRRPETRTFALFALGGIIVALVFCYVDLGLVNGRITVLFGTLLGMLAVLDRVEAEYTPEDRWFA